MTVPPRPIRLQRGLNVLEMLLILAILAILSALALPALQPLLLQHRADALRLTLHATLATARSQALHRRELIGLCASDDGMHCARDWSRGWILYRSGKRRGPPSGPQSILLHHRGRTDIAVRAESSLGRPQLYYQPDGRSPGANLTLRICAGPWLHAKLVVSNSGRARSQRIHTQTPC